MKKMWVKFLVVLPVAIAIVGNFVTAYARPGAASIFGWYTPEMPDELNS